MASKMSALQIYEDGPERYRQLGKKDKYLIYCQDLSESIVREVQAGNCPLLMRLSQSIDPFCSNRIMPLSRREYAAFLAVKYACSELSSGAIVSDRQVSRDLDQMSGRCVQIDRRNYREKLDQLISMSGNNHDRTARGHNMKFMTIEITNSGGMSTSLVMENGHVVHEEHPTAEIPQRSTGPEPAQPDHADSQARNSPAGYSPASDADRQDGEIRNAADVYREQTIAEAKRNAGQIIAEAKRNAEQIDAEAEARARERADALVRCYLRAEIAGNNAMQTVFPSDRATQTAICKDTVTDGAYQIERELTSRLDDFSNQLRGFERQLQDRLNNWRRGLYGQEFDELAEFYQLLYRQLGSGSRTVQAIAGEIRRLDAAGSPTPEDKEQLSQLLALQKTLSDLVERLGKVMGGLGLEILCPKQGDPFDPELFSDEEAASGTETTSGIVDTVRYPAVCGKDTSGYRILIRPAAVTVRNSLEKGEQK